MGEPIPTMQLQYMQRIVAWFLTLLCVIWITLLDLKHSTEEKHTSMQQMWQACLVLALAYAGKMLAR